VLWIAELIKNGFLQQNAFDPTDMYPVPPSRLASCASWWTCTNAASPPSTPASARDVARTPLCAGGGPRQIYYTQRRRRGPWRPPAQNGKRRRKSCAGGTQNDRIRLSSALVRYVGLSPGWSAPLVFVERIRDVAFDEVVEVRRPPPETSPRQGASTSAPSAPWSRCSKAPPVSPTPPPACRFLGKSLSLAVSKEMLGRVLPTAWARPRRDEPAPFRPASTATSTASPSTPRREPTPPTSSKPASAPSTA